MDEESFISKKKKSHFITKKEILKNETGYNGTYKNSHILQYIIWDQKYKSRDKEITRKDPRKCKGM